MHHDGIDLHRRTIVTCVVDDQLKVVARRSFARAAVAVLLVFFAALGPFLAVVEATASDHWLAELLEPLAAEVVLPYPGKLRVIAESVKQADRLDAQILAECLARDQIPRAHRPSPRQRQHRASVHQRPSLKGRLMDVKCELRHVLADSNAERRDLFTAAGMAHLAAVALLEADRFVADQLVAEYHAHRQQFKELAARLKAFAAAAPTAEAEARAVLKTIPGVGPVTVEVVVSELGDVDRFSSAKRACAYAGLVPAVRRSDGKGKQLPITKRGAGRLRWALVEAAWRLVRQSRRWRSVYEGIKSRRGGKKAIVAVARRLPGVMVAMRQTMPPYRLAASQAVTLGRRLGVSSLKLGVASKDLPSIKQLNPKQA